MMVVKISKQKLQKLIIKRKLELENLRNCFIIKRCYKKYKQST